VAALAGGELVEEERMQSREHELEALVRRVSANPITRRRFLAATGFSSMAAFIAACSGGAANSAAPSSAAPSAPAPSTEAPSTEPSASAPAPSPSYATEGALFMYNWADYINPENIETFKKRYNITDWTYDTYPSNEELMTRLQGGATGLYDIASPTCEFVPAMADQNFIEKLDFSRIPNASLINPQFKRFFDPAGPQAKYNDYYMAKDWGTTGIALRRKFVKDEVTTWKQFFDVAPKYDGQIVVVKSAGDVMTAPLKALGYSLNSIDPKELGEARELLRGLAPHVLLLDSDHYEDSLRSGEAVLGLTWTGGLDELKAEPETADIEYHIPTDGTLYWLDVWTILTGAPHREAAYAFLNFIQEPEIQGKETNINYYATANDAAKKYVDPAILADPTVFVSDDVIPKLEGAADVSTNPLRVEIWEEFVSSIGH
jgi:spermidine/putrescine transport system substrate-binding protein